MSHTPPPHPPAMSLHRVACPSSAGTRAAARWFRRSPDATGSARVCQTHYIHYKSKSTVGGGQSRRGVTSVARGAADVDTDKLIAHYLDDRQLAQVKTFASTLLEKNKHMNLTGALTVEEVLTRHVADSLALIPAIEEALGLGGRNETQSNNANESDSTATVKLLDVGSGAGFPGMALAIARPKWEITLLDTLQKRTTFLEEAARECGASNVKTLWSRAEDAGKVGSVHRAAYDLVTARAVAELRILSELCVPLVKLDGAFLAAKNSKKSTIGEIGDSEKAIETLGGAPFYATEVESVGPDGDLRTAVISKKVKQTPEKYPRRAGMPTKRPL